MGLNVTVRCGFGGFVAAWRSACDNDEIRGVVSVELDAIVPVIPKILLLRLSFTSSTLH